MDTAALPIPPSSRAKLFAAGFRRLADLRKISAVELAKESGLSQEEALHILRVVNPAGDNGAMAGAKSALQILQIEKKRRRITTCCETLDEILGGGISPQEVTEICGVPGVGKTQLGIQLAISVQRPEELGGLAGEAVYIDTEGSFMVERVLEMADAWLADVRREALSAQEPHLEASTSGLSAETVLSSIHYYRAYDYTEQLAVVNVLPQLLKQHPKIRLLIIDSVTFHFRQDFDDMALRTRVLNGMSQKLMLLAEKHDVAVVLVNQVTTKVVGQNQSKLVPALGESWSHACTNRVILFWMEGQRYGHIYKSPSLRAGTAPYFVTTEGIRATPATNKRPWQEQSASPSDLGSYRTEELGLSVAT
ncbi:hypothetical protein KFL_000190370 [Klebsormidium nitens]|uniref:DNA repair protein RAD51 homolog 3 n=1 Tax=Klebsormidium nitens TaxID=105231 RepID=A0A1Y1HNR5_KLENI|nr:hypothetical protein KFL_000190370 [Klebsormidium nitens]|eukprot:GAQ78819.1 hypothetical protein KFL_000190370 [Klebsormidium nitens]